MIPLASVQSHFTGLRAGYDTSGSDIKIFPAEYGPSSRLSSTAFTCPPTSVWLATPLLALARTEIREYLNKI